MEHSELIQEMVLLEKMTAQERLKHARRRRQQQLKNWTQRDASTTNGGTALSNGLVNSTPPTTTTTTSKSIKAPSKSKKTSVKFPENVVLLEGEEILRLINGDDRRSFSSVQLQHGKISKKFVSFFNPENTIQIQRMKMV